MKKIYFVDNHGNIYDENIIVIGRVGRGYIVDRTRSDLIYNGEEIGKFVTVQNQEEIKKYTEILKTKSIEDLESTKINTIMSGDGRKYVDVGGAVIDDNHSYLNFNEKMRSTLEEWLDDPLKSERVSMMDPDQLKEALVDAIRGEYTEYRLESAYNVGESVDEKDSLAKNTAKQTDGAKIAVGLDGNGIVVENSEQNKYQTIEEQTDGKYVANGAEVVSQGVNVTSNYSGTGYDNLEIEEKDEQTREVNDGVYYIDNEGNVYDSGGQLVQGVDPSAIMVDYNNCLWYNNEKVGVYGGTLDDLSQQLESTREKSNTRTLRKDDNAGFGSIGIIMVLLIVLNAIAAFVSLLLYR